MTYDVRNPEPSRPNLRTILVMIGVGVAAYVLVRWPEISSAGPIHDLLVALHLQP
jgi:hypothetical protein